MSLIDHSWEVCSEPANDSWVAGRTIGVAGYGGRRICDVTSYMCDEEAKPVADLIAAAPELLEAAEALLDIWDDGQKPHEYRAYVEGSFREQLESLRKVVAKVAAVK